MTGFIYVVASSAGLYKIGFSNDPRRRLSMLRTSSPERLTLLGAVPGTVEQERELHALLRPWRAAREWFKPCRAMQPLLDGLRPVRVKHRREHVGVVAEVLDELGGPSRAAKQIGVTGPNVVMNWRSRNSIPVEHVATVSRLTGRPLHDLRPDVFPPSAGVAA